MYMWKSSSKEIERKKDLKLKKNTIPISAVKHYCDTVLKSKGASKYIGLSIYV